MAYFFFGFLRAAAVLAADLVAGFGAILADGGAALGTSPITLLTGQILKTGHFWQPMARAMGQSVMGAFWGCRVFEVHSMHRTDSADPGNAAGTCNSPQRGDP
jgi:hypothetical protein